MTTKIVRHEPQLARSRRVRALVQHTLDERYGGGKTTEERQEFVLHAISVARALGLRVWAGNRPYNSGLHSLRSLLGENQYDRWDTSKTAGNTHWVLDVWEAACGSQITPTASDNGDVAAAEAFAQEAPVERLSVRLLNAYTNRDAEQMLALLSEIEERGL